MGQKQRVGIARWLALRRCLLRVNHDERLRRSGASDVVDRLEAGSVSRAHVPGDPAEMRFVLSASTAAPASNWDMRTLLSSQSQASCRERHTGAAVPRMQPADFPDCLGLSCYFRLAVRPIETHASLTRPMLTPSNRQAAPRSGRTAARRCCGWPSGRGPARLRCDHAIGGRNSLRMADRYRCAVLGRGCDPPARPA